MNKEKKLDVKNISLLLPMELYNLVRKYRFKNEIDSIRIALTNLIIKGLEENK